MLDYGLSGWMADFGEYLPIDVHLANGIDAKLMHNAVANAVGGGQRQRRCQPRPDRRGAVLHARRLHRRPETLPASVGWRPVGRFLSPRLSHSRATLVPALVVRDPHIVHLSHVLKAERDSGYASGRVFIESIGSAVAARLLCRQANIPLHSTVSTRELPLWRLRTVREYIDAHLDTDLSLAELARVAGFSVSHFKPLFKRAVGVPVHRYVVEQRVERARRLILQGSLSMADVALEAGFTHQSHMARWIRRVLGITPAEVAVYRH